MKIPNWLYYIEENLNFNRRHDNSFDDSWVFRGESTDSQEYKKLTERKGPPKWSLYLIGCVG